jgi:hypothetical protein
VILRGELSRPPERRELRSGSVVVEYDLRVRSGDGAAESVPVVWFDPPTGAASIEPDTELVVLGRVRRRFFRAGDGTQSRTEVVAERLLPARRAKAASRAVLEALAAAEEVFSTPAA